MVLRMTLGLVAFNFFERELKNINFHFCYFRRPFACEEDLKKVEGKEKVGYRNTREDLTTTWTVG